MELMALTWLLVLVLLVSHVTADPGDDSVNNLFSDLAPLLALFGEQFAKQFMSESLGWLDNVIFAMAPLGIVTAIVSAIRVGGPVWLKAVIGRARENRAAAEIELMSSTSHEVGELWNGTAIVRSLGRPEIEQIIYIANDPEYKKTYGLHTLESATDMGYFTIEPYQQFPGARITKGIAQLKRTLALVTRKIGFVNRFKQEDPNSRSEEGMEQSAINSGIDSTDSGRMKPAPNISLNIHRSSDTNELYVVAIAGIILQSSVLIFAGFTVYHPAFNRRFYKNDQPVSEYAYPLLLVGTVILATGMVVCSAVIEKSTTEIRYSLNSRARDAEKKDSPTQIPAENLADNSVSQKTPDITVKYLQHKADLDDARILWLQKGHLVSDQSFDSFIIFANGKKKQFLTSRRKPDSHSFGTSPFQSKLLRLIANTKFEFFAIAGSFVGFAGFVLQFQAFRGMHWSTSIAQLIAVFLMTTLRALVRRGLTVKPITEKVLENHEMDWLALGISTMQGHFWERYTGGQGGKSSEIPKGNSRPESIVMKPSRWFVVAGDAHLAQRGSLFSNEIPVSEGIKPINIRMRLGELTKWDGPAHKLAVALASAIESVMQTFFDGETSSDEHLHNAVVVSMGKGKSLQRDNSFEDIITSLKDIIASSEMRKAPSATTVMQPISTSRGILQQYNKASTDKHTPKHSQFTWILKIEVDGQIEDVHLIVRRSDEDAKWRIRVSELEALLSLWMFDFQSYPTVLDSFKSNSRTRVLGPRTSGLNRDLRWWMSDDVNRGINRTGRNVPTRPDLTIGFRGLDTYAEFAPSGKVKPGPSSPQRVDSGGEIDRLSMITTSPVDTLLAQHIFSSFMWAISEHIPSEKINKSTTAVKKGDFFNANDINSFLSCRLENRTITGLAADIERTGLVSLDEAYTFIIPPLSVANQLPVEVMADFIRQNVKEHEVNMRWEDAANIYIDLIPAIESLPSEDRFVVKAYAAVVEFYQLLTTYVNLKSLMPQSYGKITRLSQKVEILCEALKSRECTHFLRIVQGLYIIQCRYEDYLLFATTSNLLPDTLKEYKSEGYQKFYKHTNLHLAIICDEEPISKICRSNVNTKDIVDWSPLHYAVTRGSSVVGYKETILELLEQGADPTAKDIADWTPFHYVAQSGEKTICEYFIALKVGLNNPTRNGMLPIHCAAKGGNVEIIELLLDLEGVDINAVDHNGWTPLHYAAWNGRDEIVEFLLGRYARHDIDDKFGATALLRASQNKKRSTVELFARKLPNILYHAVQTENETIVRILLEYDINLDTYNDDHETPLHIACRGRHLNIIQSLLDHGANPNLPDKDHRTVFHNAIRSGKLEIVKRLAERGVNMEIGCRNKFTAMHYAALEGHTEITRFLIQQGASVQARDDQLRTPLYCAIESRNEKVVQLLLEKNSAEVNTSDYNGRTPLHCAVFLDTNSIIPMLLEHNASLAKPCGFDMLTALHIATRNGSTDTVALLLSYGANTEARCAQKCTPLHYAAMAGHEDIVNLLIKANACTDVVNEEGKTPYDEAVGLGRTEILALLKPQVTVSD